MERSVSWVIVAESQESEVELQTLTPNHSNPNSGTEVTDIPGMVLWLKDGSAGSSVGVELLWLESWGGDGWHHTPGKGKVRFNYGDLRALL